MHITIPSWDQQAAAEASARQSRLTKPEGALGDLEALSIRLVGMTGRPDWLPTYGVVVVCAADHGIAQESVSAYPQAVTYQMVLNFLRGGAAVNVLAHQMKVTMRVIDVGVIGAFEPHPMLIQAKLAEGTRSFLNDSAMTDEQAKQVLEVGIDTMHMLLRDGLDILCVGEMGIGNTTSASAIIAAITGKTVAEVTGRGTGLNDPQLQHKISVIERALAYHSPAEVNTLAKVGGFEIGAMAGLMLGAAQARIPIVLDGLISTAAALIACQIAPDVKHYLIAGHCGAEPGHQITLDYLGLKPLLRLGLRLGEGTGALLALPLIEAAMRTLHEMATFDDANVSERDAD